MNGKGGKSCRRWEPKQGTWFLHSTHQGKGGPSTEMRRFSPPLLHLHLPVVEQHPIHGLDGSSRCLVSLKVNKAIATRSIFITNHLQTQGKEDGGEGGKKERQTLVFSLLT